MSPTPVCDVLALRPSESLRQSFGVGGPPPASVIGVGDYVTVTIWEAGPLAALSQLCPARQGRRPQQLFTNGLRDPPPPLSSRRQNGTAMRVAPPPSTPSAMLQINGCVEIGTGTRRPALLLERNDERLYLFKIVLPCSRLIRLGSRSEIAFRHPARVSTDRCKPAQPVDWAKISHVSPARLTMRRQIGSNHRRSKPQVLRQSEAQTLLQTKASITPELGKLL